MAKYRSEDESMDVLKQYHNLINDFWQFIKTHPTADTDEAAAALVNDLNKFVAAHPSRFARDLVLAWAAEAERRQKE